MTKCLNEHEQEQMKFTNKFYFTLQNSVEISSRKTTFMPLLL